MIIWDKLKELSGNNQSFVLAAVVKTSGSVPGKVGFKMIVEKDGRTTGTVGGGELEQRVIRECLSRLENGSSGLQEYVLREKESSAKKQGDAEIVPMMCNGKVWIYYDMAESRLPVYIFGGGHVGQALSFYLSRLNYRIILVDDREEFAGEKMNPYAHERVFTDYIKYAHEFQPQVGSLAVIMTEGHGYDYDILHAIYERRLPMKYVGVIASRSKSAGLIEKLKKDLDGKPDLSNLYTPIGLDIGGNTESEIALSIAAEIQAVCFGKTSPHLRK